MKKKNKKKFMLGPVITIILLTFIIMFLSSLFSILGIQGHRTAIVNGTLESSLVTVKNIFTVEGIKYIFGNIVINFRSFEPLVLIIMSFIAVGIGDSSGLFKAIFSPFKKLNATVTTFLVFLLGIISSIIGEYSYIILIPLVSVMYKYLGKNQMLGVLTIFLGITLGYGTGIYYNFNAYQLGQLTQAAATIDVDKNYQFQLLSNIYIMLASTVILAFVGSLLIHKFLEPKFKKPMEEDDDLIVSKKALISSHFVFIIMLAIVIYMIIPGFPGSGLLLDNSKDTYIAKLFSETAPFRDGIMFIFLIIAMLCGGIYGYFSGNVKNTHEYSFDLSKSFDNIGYVFVLMFFTSVMTGVLEWTNLGEVIATNIIEVLSSFQFSGIPLIISFMVAIIFMSILIPSNVTKWSLASPIIIPLFMRANITPDFTQFIFKVSDGIGKAMTPLFIYFIVMIAFLQKDNKTSEEVTIFGTMKIMMPIILMVAGLWVLIIICWYMAGLPLGISGYATL
ncbi:MAG: hypothetical protein HFH08_00770 [Bacilli bacterium]|nr:hypothetical protein [Bacilli bacterium]